MGVLQHFRSSTPWNQAVKLLDQSFPLADGSHSEATAYLCYFDHLLVIKNDGTTTGLAKPSQFTHASGIEEAPCCVHLEQNGLQIEIEPGAGCAVNGNSDAHRMQLLTQIDAIA